MDSCFGQSSLLPFLYRSRFGFLQYYWRQYVRLAQRIQRVLLRRLCPENLLTFLRPILRRNRYTQLLC